MKERKLPKTDRAGSEVFAEPSLCQHPGEALSTVGARTSIQSLGHFSCKTDPQVTWASLEAQDMIYMHKQKVSLYVVIFVRLLILYIGANEPKSPSSIS